MKKPRPIQVNITFNEELLSRLRQFRIDESARRNKIVSMNGLIREAIEEKLARDSVIGAFHDQLIGRNAELLSTPQ